MALPPLPQFSNIYEGQKQRYLIQLLETTFNDYSRIQAQSQMVPQIQAQTLTSGNLGTGETTLFTANVSVNFIRSAIFQIYIKTYGTFASTANAKELRLYLNSNIIYDSTSLVVNGGNWNLNACICWNGFADQKNMVTATSSNPTLPNTAYYTETTNAVNLPITVKLTGTGVATNDIVGQVFIVTTQGN